MRFCITAPEEVLGSEPEAAEEAGTDNERKSPMQLSIMMLCGAAGGDYIGALRAAYSIIRNASRRGLIIYFSLRVTRRLLSTTVSHVKVIAQQMARALQHCHSNHVIHRY